MEASLVNKDAEVQAEDEESHLFFTPDPPAANLHGITARRAAGGFVGLAVGLMLLGAVLHLSWPQAAAPVELAGSVDGKLPVSQLSEEVVQCPGPLNVPGMGELQLVNSKVGHLGVDAGQMHLEGSAVVMHMEGRAYLADKCAAGSYDNKDYASLSLLGKTVQFTVDLSGVGCGCNVAFYFTSMKQNSDPTKCQDHYCDANSVCGVACTEVDIMEANSLVWRSTLHLQEDPVGSAAGFGGTGPHSQTWTSKEYGPGSTCIDTNRPFTVMAHFPTHDGGKFQGMMVDLQQDGSACSGLTASVGWYHYQDEDVLERIGKYLKDGMVPVVSYWKSDDMLWLDGRDVNGETPCLVDRPLDCPLVGPRITDFQVSDFNGFIHHSTMNIKPTTDPVAAAAMSPAQMPPGQVPPDFAAAGWRTVRDGAQVYYYNSVTQETAWVLPM